MRDLHTVLRVILASSLLLIAPVATTRAQFGTSELLSRGLQAYDRLPERVTLRDARGFSEAVGYLFAYEQRTYRDRGNVDDGAQRALEWLLSSLRSMQTGKADRIRSDDDLRNRGMEMYQKVVASDNGKIWGVTSFISSSANLFAYLQCASKPERDAASAYDWLVQAQDRLVTAAGSGDDPNDPESWLPATRRPGAKAAPVTTGERGGMSGGRFDARVRNAGGLPSRAVTSVAPGIVAIDTSTPAEPAKSAGAPAAPATDSLRDLSENYARTVAQLSALQSENEGLRRVNAELLAKIAQIKKEGDAISLSRDRRQARAVQLFEAGQFREARDVARSVLEIDPVYGDAHMLIARVYAAAAASGSTPEERAVAWLAIDHLTLALKGGAGDYTAGKRLYEDLYARTPTEADMAARGWVAGQKLRINFKPYEWIDEETTIRVRNLRKP